MGGFILRLRNSARLEAGFATAALTMLLFPLAVAMIGFSFDFARIAYIRSDLQGNADLAVQSASNIGYLDSNGRIVMGQPGNSGYSAEQAVDIYCANANHRTDCDSITTANIVGSPLPLEDLCSPVAAGNSYGLRIFAVEEIDTVFLGLIGIPTFTLDIESIALVRSGTC